MSANYQSFFILSYLMAGAIILGLFLMMAAILWK
jgi:hypothetical protein